jgi:hypothetical protein
MLVPELRDDSIPVGRIAKDRGGDPSAVWAGEQPGVWFAIGGVDATFDHVADLDDERYVASAFALGAFVGEAAG